MCRRVDSSTLSPQDLNSTICRFPRWEITSHAACPIPVNLYSSHVYPLGETHIICVLQPSGLLALLELKTLREACLTDDTSSLRSPFTEKWRLSTLLSEWKEPGEGVPLGGLSPNFTWIVKVSGSPRRLRIGDARNGTTFMNIAITHDEFEKGEAYGITFSSETRFYIKVDGPGRHIQIPCDIVVLSPEDGQHGITMGNPELISEPRAIPPYTLDANCEWVLDAESRKICWISPGDIRRGRGGHFWAGLSSLVMVGMMVL